MIHGPYDIKIFTLLKSDLPVKTTLLIIKRLTPPFPHTKQKSNYLLLHTSVNAFRHVLMFSDLPMWM
jgi:hypothetical protein